MKEYFQKCNGFSTNYSSEAGQWAGSYTAVFFEKN